MPARALSNWSGAGVEPPASAAYPAGSFPGHRSHRYRRRPSRPRTSLTARRRGLPARVPRRRSWGWIKQEEMEDWEGRKTF